MTLLVSFSSRIPPVMDRLELNVAVPVTFSIPPETFRLLPELMVAIVRLARGLYPSKIVVPKPVAILMSSPEVGRVFVSQLSDKFQKPLDAPSHVLVAIVASDKVDLLGS